MYWKLYCLISNIFVPKEAKDINVKAFNMINKNEAKTMTEHISCEGKCKFINRTCNSNQKCNNKTCQCEYKNYCTCKKGYSWYPSICICEDIKYLKSITDTSIVTECDIIIIVMNNVLTRKAMAANITSTASIHGHCIKVRDCSISHTVLLAIILLLIVIKI